MTVSRRSNDPSLRAGNPARASIWERPGFLVRRLHQIHVAMFVERMASGNVTPIQYGLLSILIDSPGLDQFSLGAELGIDRTNVADVLQRLEARGLISRVVDPADKRRNVCHVTAAGESFVLSYRNDMQAVQQQLLAPLTAAERSQFMALLIKLVEANNGRGRAALRPRGQRLSALREPQPGALREPQPGALRDAVNGAPDTHSSGAKRAVPTRHSKHIPTNVEGYRG